MADKMADLPPWLSSWDKQQGISYKTLSNMLMEAVTSGYLRPGDKLPPQRKLAWDLGINLSTVTKALAEVKAKGVIAGEVGRGTYVLDGSIENDLFLRVSTAGRMIDLSRSVPAQRPNMILPDLVSSHSLRYLEAYHPKELVERCKRALKLWLNYRGLNVCSSDIVPCAGAHAALMAALQTLPSRKPPLLVEEFTFPGMKAVANAMGFKMVGIKCDSEGLIPHKLEIAAKRGCSALVCVPNYQNPTGTVMSVPRRNDIKAVVKRHNIMVIEDDVYGPLSGHPPLVAELQTQAILIGSLSKIMAPGIRFGFLYHRNAKSDRIPADIHLTSWLTSPLCMEIGINLIESGMVAENVSWQKQEIRARHELIRGHLTFQPMNYAPHIWIPTPGDADVISSLCRAQGVDVASDSLFSVGRMKAQRHFLRVCVTSVPERSRLSAGMDILQSVIQDYSRVLTR